MATFKSQSAKKKPVPASKAEGWTSGSGTVTPPQRRFCSGYISDKGLPALVGLMLRRHDIAALLIFHHDCCQGVLVTGRPADTVRRAKVTHRTCQSFSATWDGASIRGAGGNLV